MKLLVIGGSGFVSGTIARTAVAQGHEVWTVTRGRRQAPPGVHTIVADRKDAAAFRAAVAGARTSWDLLRLMFSGCRN